jgi:hypothetical protein
MEFVLCNGILIEQYVEYRAINKAYVEIALKRQLQNNVIVLNKYELFVCIKYFRNDELKLLFEQNVASKRKEQKFQPDKAEVEWQISSVLQNCTKYYTNKNTRSILKDYIINDLYLLSYIKLTNDETKEILAYLAKMVNDARNTMDIFETINLFFGRQFNLYHTEFDGEKIIGLIESLLDKYIRGSCNLYERESLKHNKIFNLFAYLEFLKNKFSNLGIIERLLKKLTVQYEDITDLTYIAQNLLLCLYQVSNEECQIKIKEYILSFQGKENPDDIEGNLSFLLSLLQLNFINDFLSIANKLEDYLKQRKSDKIVSSRIFGIKRQVETLQKNHSEFTNCITLLDELIEWYNLNKFPSYI